MSKADERQAVLFFEGIINLRGRVIPVLGLGKKVGLAIIINVGANNAGIIVDVVCDVLKIAEDSIETDVNLCDMAGRAITGIAKRLITG